MSYATSVALATSNSWGAPRPWDRRRRRAYDVWAVRATMRSTCGRNERVSVSTLVTMRLIQQTMPFPIDGTADVGNNSSGKHARHAETLSCCYQTLHPYKFLTVCTGAMLLPKAQCHPKQIAETTGLVPIVQQPTRKGNILDQILVSQPCYRRSRLIVSNNLLRYRGCRAGRHVPPV